MKDAMWWTTLLSDVPENKAFKLKNNSVTSLVELASALHTVTDNEFHHHVNAHKNDFAQWIQDVLNDEELAQHVRQKKSAPAMAHEIDKRIKEAHAHVAHQQKSKPTQPRIRTIVDNIEQLEKDLNSVIGHTSKNAHYMYPKAKNLTMDVAYKIHWKEVVAGILIGIIFAILLLSISGVL